MTETLNNTDAPLAKETLKLSWPVPRRRRALCALLVLGGLLMVACATPHPRAKGQLGPCDPSADAAVEQQQWEKALAGHERLLAQFPAHCLAMYHLGFIWGHLGDRSMETQYYESAISCGFTDDDQLYFNLGMAYGDLGDLDRAVQAFERAVAINPANSDNYFGLGLAHQTSGSPALAESAWLQAVFTDPMHRDARLALARLFLDQSRWDEAELHLNKVQQSDPQNEEAAELRELLRSRRSMQYEQ